ncbi:MAG: 1-deoxy-D-xylulose-5-phosphate synthase [Clostridiales bacterium]|nr:1-deoxy-D-xylulose-5-phosphate synthase [Clostridiales bacterium]
MALLEAIEGPQDVKKLNRQECEELAAELRRAIITTVSRQGGHLASNLGIVEVTIALHRAFASPEDQLIFDVGHQVYAHKLLTGRQDRFQTLRSYGGISGFPCRAESPHDLFDTGHSSTAISMALGLARARDLSGETRHVVAVVGDGALTGGMCYEAMNDAGNTHTKLIVVLNDNGMSISKNVGALSDTLKHLRASSSWYAKKKRVRRCLERIPAVGKTVARVIMGAIDMVKTVTTGGGLFEALGFRYLGPFDGHNVEELTHVFEEAKAVTEPVIIHVLTQKGKGYDLAEQKPEKYHGIAPFRVENGMKRKISGSRNAAVTVGETLCALAEEDTRVVAITAAMKEGVGLSGFADRYPERFFDVGIAEEHALSMAAGLARGGMRPYFAVYATFFQRAFDQLVHDVALQGVPVCILADHAGLVGDDGKTHHGVLAGAMTLPVPGLTVLAPRDTRDLAGAIRLVNSLPGPSVIAFPKEGIEPYAESGSLAVGHWQTLRKGTDAALLSFGRMVKTALRTAELLNGKGVSAAVVDCASLKPMDRDCLRRLSRDGIPVFTMEEEQKTCGFGAEVARLSTEMGIAPPAGIFGIGDEFVPHGDTELLLRDAGLSPESLAERIFARLREEEHVE